MPARAFFFIVVEEIGQDGFLVRKIYASPKSPYLTSMNLSPLQKLSELFPEKYGMTPKSYGASTGIAEHVLGNNKSSYISSSSIFPEGSPRFQGRRVYIDIAKAMRAGAKIVPTDEIINALSEYKSQNPHLAKRIEKISSYVKNIDQEVLIQGRNIPPNAIFNESSLKITTGIVKSARVVGVVGIVFTAYDLSSATGESFRAKTVKPITAEVVRQAGGWGAAAAGLKIGTVAGAAVGITTGPGAIVTGLIGGLVFGIAGYFGADWVADHIYKN
jgi:hypothetical protein